MSTGELTEDNLVELDCAELYYSMISGVSSSRESGGAVMSVVEYLQEELAEFSRRHSPIALIAEYNNAIAVLTGR